MNSSHIDRPGRAIALICVGVFFITVNDMIVKSLSGGYPLHEIVLLRTAVAMVITLGIVLSEGGLSQLRTRRPVMHALRGLTVVISSLLFFSALAVMPLGQATAMFFVAPLFITLLSIPLLGEKVGPYRLGAVLVGFVGVAIVYQPWKVSGGQSIVLALPILSALFYAFLQVMTRKLGVASSAGAMSFYNQIVFMVVSIGVFAVAGDGRYAEGVTNESLQFILRAWIWPSNHDLLVFLASGTVYALAGYLLTAAYRLADAATVAPFEYIGLPAAFFWGWVIFGERPSLAVWAGCVLIVGAGLVVFMRERRKPKPIKAPI
ncbi:DMT family transporter [Pseudoprimorskyibacter insulae]|uniref:Riboflavin transporter n=1 Tax=Pseudoprimorskyibacter insulae TaxID=1695997 RepID=A0A2R8APF7_9RHOB|nr:DMT family transporter [Pseudoprimorskyibacter insulae]SPF77870.1 Riboflavin transporter [Pseudoprimorskyibacter insulae]